MGGRDAPSPKLAFFRLLHVLYICEKKEVDPPVEATVAQHQKGAAHFTTIMKVK